MYIEYNIIYRDEPDMLDKRPDLIKNSNYFTQVIKVSWNIIGEPHVQLVLLKRLLQSTLF